MKFQGDQHELQPHQLEALHQLLFREPVPVVVRLSRLINDLGITGAKGICILKLLSESGVVHVDTVTCPQCGNSEHSVVEFCPVCHQDLFSLWAFTIDGNLHGDELQAFGDFRANRLLAEHFSNSWIQQGFVYYLLIDLVESEYLQRNSSLEYNQFFSVLRGKLQETVFPKLRRKVLPLGEIGDCLKIAFLDTESCIEFLRGVQKIVDGTRWESVAPHLIGREVHFPSLDGTLGKLTLNSFKRKTPSDLLVVTLSGQLDFNDIELTRLFRYDTAIETNREVFSSSSIAVWIDRSTLVDMGWANHAVRDIEFCKHGKSFHEQFALFRLGKTGEFIENDEQLALHTNKSTKHDSK